MSERRKKEPLNPFLEEEAYAQGFVSVCGCDEAGRGPLAGPVVAAAVILPRGLVIPGLDDSKKLSEKKREELFDLIRAESVAYGTAEASAQEIDEINILNASMLAMRRAMEALPVPADFALIDGNTARGFSVPVRTVVGGDGISPSIAAASVLAKVSRDRFCMKLEQEYPGYGFAKHKGYPTKEHRDAVKALGPSPVHRKTFLRFLDAGAETSSGPGKEKQQGQG
ncbi:MAG: ribonuclease HII [Clostridia bacterium]|nr:ribonuclease HII [Clostridia bacterium]